MLSPPMISCALVWVGVLAQQRRAGPITWVAQRLPQLVFRAIFRQAPWEVAVQPAPSPSAIESAMQRSLVAGTVARYTTHPPQVVQPPRRVLLTRLARALELVWAQAQALEQAPEQVLALA